MVALQACRARLTDCPNPLLDSDPWLAAVESWLKDKDVSERLRRKIEEDKILFHHKLKISLSACPNGCSRPQIADVGLVGRAWPDLDPAECAGCGACIQACPDQALAGEAGQAPALERESCQGCRRCSTACPAGCFTLSRPRLELRLGGRLGRHPRLAEPVGRFDQPEELITVLDRLVEDYLTQARLGQRCGDYWIARRRSS
jgi:dissimilatory sulfite reductase (desulfoviridin) alpha/beta subunit